MRNLDKKYKKKENPLFNFIVWYLKLWFIISCFISIALCIPILYYKVREWMMNNNFSLLVVIFIL